MELAGAPAPRFAELENLANQRGMRGMRTLPWAMRAIEKALEAGGSVAREPFVAGLATDPIAPAEFRKGAGGGSASNTKRCRSYMGDVTLQGIGASLRLLRYRKCHLSGEYKVLPIN